MKNRKRTVRIGTFDALEGRVVLNGAQNQAIVKDVTSFYSDYVMNVPTLVQTYTAAKAQAASSGAAADQTAAQTAATNLTNAITTDVNSLGHASSSPTSAPARRGRSGRRSPAASAAGRT